LQKPPRPSGAEVLKVDSNGPRVWRRQDRLAPASPDLSAEGLGLVEKSVHKAGGG